MAKLEVQIQAKDDASKALNNISANTAEMTAEFRKAGLAMTAAGAAMAAGLALTVKAFAQDEAGVMRLSVAMRNVGLSYEANTASIERNINALQQKTGVSDNEQRNSLASLIRITRNTAEAFELLELGMDVAIGTERDLASATTLLMYALSGNWGQIEQYIPALKQAQTEEAKWAMMRELFAGQAETYGNILEGQMQTMSANIGDISEKIGGVLAPTVSTIISHFSQWINRMNDMNPLLFKFGTIATTATAGILMLAGGVALMIGYLPKMLAFMTAQWVFVVTKWIPSIIATTAAYAAQFVMAMAIAGATGQWWLVAAGVAAVATAAALASAAIYGLTKGIQTLITEETEEKSIIHDVRQATISLTDAIKEQTEVMEDQKEVAKGLPGYMETALNHMLKGYEENFDALNSEMVADLTSIRDRLVDTYGSLGDDVQPGFDEIISRLDAVVAAGGSLSAITDLTAAMTAEFDKAGEEADQLAVSLATMPAEVEDALGTMLSLAEGNLGDLSDAFLETMTKIRDDLKGLYDVPEELARRLNAVIDAEGELDSAARLANIALKDQEIASLRAAEGKGNLAEAAERLGLSEDEARTAIAAANADMTDQEIAAYAAGRGKKSLAEVAEELGISEYELEEKIAEANRQLKEQSAIKSGAGVGQFSTGASKLFEDFTFPGFAEGALVTKPTLAWIAEKGPEIVAPVGKLPKGILPGPMNDFQELIRNDSGIAASLPEKPIVPDYNVQGGNTYSVTIQAGAFMGDPAQARQYGRMVLDTIRQEEIRRTGAVKK